MSKQSSDHPDAKEETRAKSPSNTKKRKLLERPWVLMSRYHMKHTKPRRWTRWSVDGRYKTKEQAEKVRDKKLRDYGGILAGFYQFDILNTEE